MRLQSMLATIGAVLCCLMVFLSHPGISYGAEAVDDISVSVTAKSIGNFVSKLLPYRIDLGRGFSGNFHLKSIDNIEIKEDKIYFSSYIQGENVTFKTKIGKQEIALTFGNIDLRNQWHVAYRHESEKGVLYIRPHLVDPKTHKKSSQGDMFLTALFGGLSDIEYPVDLNDLSPIVSKLFNKTLTIHVSVTRIETTDNRLKIYIKPIPKIETIKKPEK